MTSKAMTPTTRTVDIDGEAYTLKFNFGMACAVEQELGVSLQRAFSADAPAMTTIGVVWWAALQASHPMTREASNELIDAVGIEQATQWVIDGISGYFGGGQSKSGDVGKARKKPARTRR